MCNKKFNNYSNIYSTITAPIVANTNELFPMTNTSSSDWMIDKNNNKILICKNKGI